MVMSANIGAETDFDVVIIGSGAGGLTAAIVAARLGLKTLILEKTGFFGGTTAVSGGGLWIPNNHHMASLGLTDSVDRATEYLRALMGKFFDASKCAAFLEHGPQMLRFLEIESEIQFGGGLIPDYEPSLPGSATGRTLLTPSYDGTRLGSDVANLRPALDQFGIFGGMQIGFEDAGPFMAMMRSPAAFRYSAGKFLRYVWDRVRHGRAMRLVNGNALVARLLATARQCGVTLLRNADASALMTDSAQTVCGVIVRTADGRSVEVRARRGVILASGGYGANQQMRRDNVPMADSGWSLQPEGNTGDGIRLGESVGATFVRSNIDNGIWAPMSSLVTRSGERVNFSHIMLDRHRPGFIVIDTEGKRFVNEGASYQAFCKAMHERGIANAWLIGTHAAIRKHSMGMAKAAPLPIGRYIANGYLRKANSIRELAVQIAINPDTLAATVESFNGFATQGYDPDFHRGEDGYSASQGDPDNKPNPSLGSLIQGPFYAIELHPGELSTLNGLETDDHAQVVDEHGHRIGRLYAVGIDANSVFRGAYPGGGASLGPTMTFAYIAAKHIASATPGTQTAGSASRDELATHGLGSSAVGSDRR
jgi:succinate dehydrogenase/fumarate reductase flavoprotein subunit